MMPSTLEELAGATQLALEVARQRHVTEREDRRFVLGEDADRGDRHRDAIARGGHQLEIEVVDRLAGDSAPDLALEGGPEGLGDELHQQAAGEAVARVARDLLGGAVEVEHGARGVEDDDAVGGAVDEGAVALDGAHAALLADVGERDAPGALADRLERLRAAQDHAEERRRQAPEADRGLRGPRRPLAREAGHERAGRLAADDDREHGRDLARRPRGQRRVAAAGEGHLPDLQRALDVRVASEREAGPPHLDLVAVGDEVDVLGIGEQR